MPKYTIDKNAYKDYTRQIELATVVGGSSSKKLIASVNFTTKAVEFLVMDNKGVILVKQTLDEAIDCYNEI